MKALLRCSLVLACLLTSSSAWAAGEDEPVFEEQYKVAAMFKESAIVYDTAKKEFRLLKNGDSAGELELQSIGEGEAVFQVKSGEKITLPVTEGTLKETHQDIPEEYKESIKEMERLLGVEQGENDEDIDPIDDDTRISFYYSLAGMYQRFGYGIKGWGYMEQALLLQGEEFESDNSWLNMEGILCITLKCYLDGLECFEAMLDLDENDNIAHYNIACVYSLLDKKDEALDALERSIDCGFDLHDHMQQDPDLENIREEARFEELLDRLK